MTEVHLRQENREAGVNYIEKELTRDRSDVIQTRGCSRYLGLPKLLMWVNIN